jgi:hypothetical protein
MNRFSTDQSLIRSKLPTPEDVIVGDLARRGQWVVGNVVGSIPWPTKVQKVKYRGLELFIMPVMERYYPAIALLLPSGMAVEEGQRIIAAFTSSLAWVENGAISIEYFGGGNLPRPFGSKTPYPILQQGDLDLSYLPEPTLPAARLALALHREGKSLNHNAYAFLAYFKVLEAALPESTKRAKWVEENLDAVRKGRAKTALEALEKKYADVGKHIYESGRCAAAHANRAPSFDPDDPADLKRLGFELPLVEALAVHAIETVLGIKTDMTVYSEHLYELEGFKKIFGREIVQKLVSGEESVSGEAVEIPHLRIAIAGKDSYRPFAEMHVIDLAPANGEVFMTLKSSTCESKIRFLLDFADERLRFDAAEDIGVQDDGTAEAASNIAEVGRFMRDYWSNGRLQIFNAETGDLISYCDPFIPVNAWIDVDAINARIDEWDRLAETRSKG